MQKKLFLLKLLFFSLLLFLPLFNLFGKIRIYLLAKLKYLKEIKQAVNGLEIYMMPVNG